MLLCAVTYLEFLPSRIVKLQRNAISTLNNDMEAYQNDDKVNFIHDVALLAYPKTMKALPLFHPCGSEDRASMIQRYNQNS